MTFWQRHGLNKPLWEWLDLLIIPAVLALIALGFNIVSLVASQQQHQVDLQIAASQQQESTLTSYLDQMSGLLLNNKDVRNPQQPGKDTRSLARARTLTALSTLDKQHKRSIMQFLYEGNLINRSDQFPIVSLAQADLTNADLSKMKLSGADLANIDLSNAQLNDANLSSAYLSAALLNNVNLENANLSYAQLTEGAQLLGADLRGADLCGADLVGADLRGAQLDGANLSGADLSGALVTQEQLAQVQDTKCWQVVSQQNNILAITYGSGTSFPQYGALDTKSGYLRLNYGPTSGWGTSIILPPAFWSKVSCPTVYCQGAPVNASWEVTSSALVFSLTSTIGSLQVSMTVKLSPPQENSISAHVQTSIVSGTVQLDAGHPGERFKLVMLSSMHVSSTQWDAQSAYADSQSFTLPLPGNAWTVAPAPPVVAQKFGLIGGTSAWKKNAPTVEVQLEQPAHMQIAGWATSSTDPNNDNLGLWSASDTVVNAWSYTVVVSGPPTS